MSCLVLRIMIEIEKSDYVWPNIRRQVYAAVVGINLFIPFVFCFFLLHQVKRFYYFDLSAIIFKKCVLLLYFFEI